MGTLTGTTKYDDVTYSIRRLIVERGLRPSDRLPSERALAEILGVNRTSVREALRQLEAVGLVQTTARRGAYVAPNDPEAMSTAIRGWFEARRLKLAHLIELRRALESAAAAKAAKSRGSLDLAAMEADLEVMASAMLDDDPLRFAAADEAFHNHVAAASQNPLFDAGAAAAMVKHIVDTAVDFHIVAREEVS